MISMIVAMDKNGLIGKDGGLPWDCPVDRNFFKIMTEGKTVIMGRKTFESIGKPLNNRLNIVVSNKQPPGRVDKNLIFASTFDHAIVYSQVFGYENNTAGEVFVIGGSQIYKDALPYTSIVYLNTIKGDFGPGDTYFPLLNKELDDYLSNFELFGEIDGEQVNMKMYGRNLLLD